MPSARLAYAVIMLLAVGVAYVISRRTQARLQLDPVQRVGIAFGAFCGAMLGAKLPFVLGDWSGLASGMAWFSDGKTILTGLVGGYCGVELAKWSLDVRTRTGDTFVVPVAVAIGIGRLACFIIGCCYGVPTTLPWGVEFPTAGDNLPRHPTQIYEAAFHLTLAGVGLILLARGVWRGNLMKAYIVAYAVYRFATEFIRPEAVVYAGLTGYQWACLALIAGFGALWYRDLPDACNSRRRTST